MKKAFAVNLKSVEYLGDSIGDDIFIEIKLADQVFKLDKKIKHKTKAEINKEIGHFETEENILELSVNIKITEDDALFDDVGSKQGILKIDLSKSLPQNQNFEVLVNEKRGLSGKRIAKFRVVLEVALPIRYVEDVDDQGWLIVAPDDGARKFSISSYLKVQLNSKHNNYDYFTIIEGVKKNTKAHISLKSDGASRFTNSKKVLKYKNKSFRCDDDPDIKGRKGDDLNAGMLNIVD